VSTFDELRSQLGRAWESVAEGWQHLRSRAADALTRFTPAHRPGELETVEDAVVRSGAHWGLLAAEVRETEDALVVRLEVAGMDPDGFEIVVVDHDLVVRGEKRVERESREGRYHLMECAYGSFERRVPLPVEVDQARASARYRAGVLQVTLPKRGHHGARRITVESVT
jgi:HSP20 family protein